jgi:hypothetical protein
MLQRRTTTFFSILIAFFALWWPAIVKARTPVSVAGHWRGTRSATGGSGSDAFKIHNISFDLKQSGDGITGTYRCYAAKKANTECNNPVGNVTGGKIEDGKVTINVQAQPNSLQCTFNGSLEGSKMKGQFTCYEGGGLQSNGVFDVHRKE